MMKNFIQTILYTDIDGRAKFKEEAIPFTEGTPQSMLSRVFESGGMQLRESPVGFRSQIHCTGKPQWVFFLKGQMKIGLQDGSYKVFTAGEHFYSADTLPEGEIFDAGIHGHWSAQLGDAPLQTLFVRS